MYNENVSIVIENNVTYEVVTTHNGAVMWYIPHTSCWHRELGPAVVFKNGTSWWFHNGKRHNINGPATIWNTGNKEYWINGKKLHAKNDKEFQRSKKLIILE